MNTDRVLAVQFLEGGGKPLPLASNPLARALAGELLELDAERGSALLAFTPPQQFLQGAGVIQGGIVAALLDFAMAFAALAALGGADRPFATATLQVSLMKPAPPGRYLARGRIVRKGRRLMFAEAALAPAPEAARGQDGARAPDAATVATASAVMPFTDS
ncbi:MAG: PaaI family thioesterase [Steroidobacteraceae bacterium]